jgi:nitrite reductase (NADH) small subunit
MSALLAPAVAWIDVCAVEDIPLRGARRVEGFADPIAIFRTGDDRVFALVDRCPHKHGPLSMGIVHGHAVTCPLHNWVIDLKSGEPTGADAGKGCAPTIDLRVVDGRVLISHASA